MTERTRPAEAEAIIERLAPVLSPWPRVRGVLGLVAGLVGTAFVATLWGTEPGPLPVRTHLAFAVLGAACLAWTGHGTWVVTRKAPLFALDRVVAAWIGLAASLAATAMLVVVAVDRDGAVLPVAAVGTVFAGVALVVTAHRRRAALLRRKRELQAR